MGLSGPKRRHKISSDPNNTAWSKSADTFGHKILASQGWRPGQVLGAENAAHAEHYTAANASHIRVMLREDNLGLGAQLGQRNAETFGLSTLSGIFGRLNGQSEAVIQKVQDVQRDVGLRSYHSQKFGHMSFVRGGMLVGDKMTDLDEQPALPSLNSQSMPEPTPDRKQRLPDGFAITNPSQQTKTRALGLPSDHAASSHNGPKLAPTEVIATTNANSKPHTKCKMRDKVKAHRTSDEGTRQARKEERRRRREERRKRKDRELSTLGESNVQADLPSTSSQAPSNFAGDRLAVRQRYIQQKRMASMDPQALKEILMVTAAVG